MTKKMSKDGLAENENLSTRMAKLMKQNFIINRNHVDKIARQMRENEKHYIVPDKAE